MPYPQYFHDPDWQEWCAPVYPPEWAVREVERTGQPVGWYNGMQNLYDKNVKEAERGNWIMLYLTRKHFGKIITHLLPGSSKPIEDWLYPLPTTPDGWFYPYPAAQ